MKVLHVITRMNTGGPAVFLDHLTKSMEDLGTKSIIAYGYCESNETDYTDTHQLKAELIKVKSLHRSLNLMYRKNLMLGRRWRGKGQFPGSRGVMERLLRAQCSTAQWHGTKGGLHLPHLREAIWRELILAESEMRAGQAETELAREDVNADGQIEVMAGHPAMTLLFAPHLGGSCLEVGLPELGEILRMS